MVDGLPILILEDIIRDLEGLDDERRRLLWALRDLYEQGLNDRRKLLWLLRQREELLKINMVGEAVLAVVQQGVSPDEFESILSQMRSAAAAQAQ